MGHGHDEKLIGSRPIDQEEWKALDGQPSRRSSPGHPRDGVLESPRQRDFDRSLEPHPEALSRIRAEGNFGE
jgi:hypothetical protein